jgi:hypothetical protein
MLLALGRVSRSAHVGSFDADAKTSGAAFLRDAVDAFPCRVHAVPTGNGMAFAGLPRNRGRHAATEAIFGGHIFDRVCRRRGVERRLTKPCHPWANGTARRRG